MPSQDPAHCREQLATLMTEANNLLAALEDLLTQEHELLQSRDADGLENAATKRQQCIGHILRIEDERRALCRNHGRGDDAAGLHSLLTWCDPTGLLWPAMQEYRERTQRCRDQNDRNGILVNGRLQSDRAAGEGRTYGPGSKFSTRA
jgi:flagellar biosynthesis/type III secretory pathway chaperone